ncbi:MAG: flavodoxin domain-containing protein [Candidatus Lokiarchaeota archaeon]|nr:flavodoxin domain-containing protein [Candidatus Lokiarchaeota archaeon]
MKIHIVYYTSTGNTRKIALAIRSALDNHDVDVLELEDYQPRNLIDYELLILGSGVYLGLVGDKLIEFVRNAINFTLKYACFYSRERKEPYPDCFQPIREEADLRGSNCIGEFHCLGEPFTYYSNEE